MRYIIDNRRLEKMSSRCNEKWFFSSNFENENLGFPNQRAEHIVCTWVTENQVIAATALTNVHRTYLWNRMWNCSLRNVKLYRSVCIYLWLRVMADLHICRLSGMEFLPPLLSFLVIFFLLFSKSWVRKGYCYSIFSQTYRRFEFLGSYTNERRIWTKIYRSNL